MLLASFSRDDHAVVDRDELVDAVETTAGGRLLFNVMDALTELERELIVEHTHAGLTAAP